MSGIIVIRVIDGYLETGYRGVSRVKKVVSGSRGHGKGRVEKLTL